MVLWYNITKIVKQKFLLLTYEVLAVGNSIKLKAFKVLDYVSMQANTSSVWLAIMAVLLAVGLITANDTALSHFPLISIFNEVFWAVLLVAYATVKLLQSTRPVNHCVTIFTSVLGAWIWNYMIVSFVFLDPKPLEASDLLLFVPVVCEVLDLALDMVRWRNPHCKGKHLL